MSLQSSLRHNTGIFFIGIGMLVVLGGVYVVQNNRFVYTQAASSDGLASQASDWQFQFNPSDVKVDSSTGVGQFKVKLASLDDPITKARLVLNHDPAAVEILDVQHKAALDDVQFTPNQAQTMIISEGEFWGEASWVMVEVRLKPGVDTAVLTIDQNLSELQLGDNQRLELSGQLSVNR